jgi:sugar O-acyltransferase (sialic acid O-acetyltransferase NeuD family)
MAGRISAATERAIKRAQGGELISRAARAEGIDPSTLFRALGRRKDRNDGALGRFVIVGAGALGRELAQWIRMDARDEPVVFLDDNPAHAGVIGNVDSYQRVDGDEVLIAIADPMERAAVADRFVALGTFIAASVTAGNCSIGAGCLILPHALVSADVTIGAGCMVNTGCSIGHDVALGDFCTLSSNVSLAGRVKVGKRVFFGTGATVIPRVSIGDDAHIGAGSVVVKDVPAGARYFGNPARAVA